MTEGRWRHKNASDIDLWVSKVEESPDFFRLWVYYILRSNGNTLNKEAEVVEINKRDLHKWSRV